MRTGAVTSLIGICADVVIDISTIVMLGGRVGMLTDTGIIGEISAVIGLDCIVRGVFSVEVLTGEWAEAIIGDVSGIGGELNVDGLSVTTAALEFAVPASCELFLCC